MLWIYGIYILKTNSSIISHRSLLKVNWTTTKINLLFEKNKCSMKIMNTSFKLKTWRLCRPKLHLNPPNASEVCINPTFTLLFRCFPSTITTNNSIPYTKSPVFTLLASQPIWSKILVLKWQGSFYLTSHCTNYWQALSSLGELLYYLLQGNQVLQSRS